MDSFYTKLPASFKKYFMANFYSNLKLLGLLILVIIFMIFMAIIRGYSTGYTIVIGLTVLVIIYFWVLFFKNTMRYYWDAQSLEVEKTCYTLTANIRRNTDSKYWTTYTIVNETNPLIGISIDSRWDKYLTDLPLDIAVYRARWSKDMVRIELLAKGKFVDVLDVGNL